MGSGKEAKMEFGEIELGVSEVLKVWAARE